jgi:hypothetical protein
VKSLARVRGDVKAQPPRLREHVGEEHCGILVLGAAKADADHPEPAHVADLRQGA